MSWLLAGVRALCGLFALRGSCCLHLGAGSSQLQTSLTTFYKRSLFGFFRSVFGALAITSLLPFPHDHHHPDTTTTSTIQHQINSSRG
jgi:hypothetical protein